MMSKPDEAPTNFVRPKAFYDLWQEREGIPIYKVFHVENLADVELGEWNRLGCRGAFVNLADPHITTAAILEIPPGGRTHPVKHIFEALIYGISGWGKTTVRSPGSTELSVEWSSHSLLSPPLNTTYSHHNLDASRPLRLLMVSNAPLVLSLFHNERFVFDNPVVFDDRFHGQPDFFSNPGKHLGGRVWRTNFIPDVSRFTLIEWVRRGSGAKSFHISMADNTIACHLSEFEVGTYKKGHRHGPGAHVIILAGEGYSLLWQEGKERVRVDWRPGSIFCPPEWWYHQHFNTGSEPARYLALRRGGSPEHPLRIGMRGGNEEAGAEQIEYEDEDPEIREMYVRELAAKGVELRMAPRPTSPIH
ncbi:MAG: ethanolamine ammonia lyase-activating protein [Deltaproteobacteria bacterium]|nr:ethanolamine ammonia lyase-activating protein [Deltaproteobacteria bacterium]